MRKNKRIMALMFFIETSGVYFTMEIKSLM